MDTKYSLVMAIRISHEYYGRASVPIQLVPDATTHAIFQKYGIIIKRHDNTWSLYGSDRSIPYFRDMGLIRCAIKLTDGSFLYVTDFQKTDTIPSLSGIAGASVEYMLQIPADCPEVQIHFKSVTKYFEYIFFSSGSSVENMYMQSTDIRHHVEFGEMNRVAWADKKAIQLKSKQKLLLTKFNQYQFSLIGKSSFGDRVLLQHITSPDPRSASIYEPYHTLAAYYSL